MAKGLKILIVEDHVDCAESLALFLRLYGHEVDIAWDGPEGVEMARAGRPDVVLLDIGLPGMNGYEVAKRLSAPRPKLTPMIIAVSGYIRNAHHWDAEQSGIDYYMAKPVMPDELQTILQRFQRLLGSMPPAAEPVPDSIVRQEYATAS